MANGISAESKDQRRMPKYNSISSGISASAGLLKGLFLRDNFIVIATLVAGYLLSKPNGNRLF